MSRTLALAAGGTGGHMFPAAALAEEAKRRGWRTLLLTDERGLRFADGFPADEVVELKAANPNVRGAQAKLEMAFAMLGGTRTAQGALRRAKPFAVVGFGGYPSAPAMVAAKIGKRRHGLHEQNAVLGRVNRRIAPGADFVAHGFERLDMLSKARGAVVQTGNPVRDAVRAARRPYPPPAADGPIRVLVIGGSQGASLFSRVFPRAFSALPEETRERLEIVQQAREGEADAVSAIYADAGLTVELQPFFADLPRRMAEAHLIVSRAGASTVTELSVLGRPSLLIPLAIAMDDHQRANAEVLTRAGGAEMIPETGLTEDTAEKMLCRLLTDPDRLARMAAAAEGQVPDDAAARLADLCEGLLE